MKRKRFLQMELQFLSVRIFFVLKESSFGGESLNKKCPLGAADDLIHVHIADSTRETAGLGSTDSKQLLYVLKLIGYRGIFDHGISAACCRPIRSTGYGHAFKTDGRICKIVYRLHEDAEEKHRMTGGLKNG